MNALRFVSVLAAMLGLAACMTEVDPQLPGSPTHLDFTQLSRSSVRVHWVGSSLATSYRLERAVDADTMVVLGEVRATSWVDTGLVVTHRYTYRVTSIGENGSSWSSPQITIAYSQVHPLLRSVNTGSNSTGTRDMALDPTGALFASCDDDVMGVRVWRSSDWSLHGIVRPDTIGRPRCVAFTADGATLFVGGTYGIVSVRLADLATIGSMRMGSTGYGDTVNVRDIVPIPGGTRAVVASTAGRLQVWDLADGSLVADIDTIGPTSTWANAVSPDGRLLAAVWDRGMVVWDLVVRDVRFVCSGVPSGPLFNPAGSILSVGLGYEWGGRWKRANLSTTSWTTMVDFPAGSEVTAFSPDGAAQLVGSGYNVQIVRLSDGEIDETLTGHGEDVVFVAYLSDGRSFMSRDGSNIVKIWSGETQEGWTIDL